MRTTPPAGTQFWSAVPIVPAGGRSPADWATNDGSFGSQNGFGMQALPAVGQLKFANGVREVPPTQLLTAGGRPFASVGATMSNRITVSRSTNGLAGSCGAMPAGNGAAALFVIQTLGAGMSVPPGPVVLRFWKLTS